MHSNVHMFFIQKMSTHQLRAIIGHLELTQEFALEIEDYFHFQLEHNFASTNLYQRVRANLHGDEPLPWTAVQIYLHILTGFAGGSSKERTARITKLAFPSAARPREKVKWIMDNSGIPQFLLCYFILWHTNSILFIAPNRVAIAILYCGTLTPYFLLHQIG